MSAGAVPFAEWPSGLDDELQSIMCRKKRCEEGKAKAGDAAVAAPDADMDEEVLQWLSQMTSGPITVVMPGESSDTRKASGKRSSMVEFDESLARVRSKVLVVEDKVSLKEREQKRCGSTFAGLLWRRWRQVAMDRRSSGQVDSAAEMAAWSDETLKRLGAWVGRAVARTRERAARDSPDEPARVPARLQTAPQRARARREREGERARTQVLSDEPDDRARP